jgi:hypothetical protein
MNPLPKDPTVKAERKVQQLLSKHKTALATNLRHKLTPYCNGPNCVRLEQRYNLDTKKRSYYHSVIINC